MCSHAHAHTHTHTASTFLQVFSTCTPFKSKSETYTWEKVLLDGWEEAESGEADIRMSQKWAGK